MSLIVEYEIYLRRSGRHVAHLSCSVDKPQSHGHLCINRHAERADAEAEVGLCGCRSLEDDAAVEEGEFKLTVLAVVVADATEVALDAHEG